MDKSIKEQLARLDRIKEQQRRYQAKRRERLKSDGKRQVTVFVPNEYVEHIKEISKLFDELRPQVFSLGIKDGSQFKPIYNQGGRK